MKRGKSGAETLDLESIQNLSRQINQLRKSGYHIIVVSSGAITAGIVATDANERPSKDKMPELQRLASIGWRYVLNAWAESLIGNTVAEVLVTSHELSLESECRELAVVTHSILEHGDILIANENDVLAHQEIAIGDNDRLAAMFASLLKKSSLFGNNINLVILSDVEGLYSDIQDKTSLITEVNDLDKYEHLAGNSGSKNGTGGMRTKFVAARIAKQAGITVYIANGRQEMAIQRSISGDIGTRFT
jgi:glutamate 5-kinase